MKSLVGVFSLFASFGSMLLSSSVFANSQIGCDYVERDRCRDCDAITKLSCGAIEGYILNNTKIESLTLLLKNKETQTQRHVTINNLGNIGRFSFHFGLTTLLKEREIIFSYKEEVSIAANGVHVADDTLIYSSIFGANFNNVPITTVSEALATNPAMECNYVTNPLIVVDLIKQIRTSCFAEVQCRTGSGEKLSPIQISCYASGTTGNEFCPSAIECAVSEDTLLIRLAK